MFNLALAIGIYSYAIFFIGVLHLLTRTNIILITVPFVLFLISKFKFPVLQLNKLTKIFLSLLIAQLLVNLVGALGQELGYDALWYHLTLPKIWLQKHELIFISGTHFKYSVMPMLTEMFYFIFPGKLIHYLFGILTLITTYKISRSWLAVLILSSNLVFNWEQTSAYIDLARAFFETMALYMFLQNKIYKSAIMLGFAISTKLLALGSLPIFWLLIILKYKNIKLTIRYTLITILIVSPWLIRAYISTGNPIYPFLTPMCCDAQVPLNPIDLLNLFTHAADPISPIYILVLPLILLVRQNKYLHLYSFLTIVAWILTPNMGGGRFILPYLPALSITSASVITHLKSKILIYIVIISSIFSITYRSFANFKYFRPLTPSVTFFYETR